MFRYLAYGLVIDSEIYLGAGAPLSDTPPDVTVRAGEVCDSGAKALPDEDFLRHRGLGVFHVRSGRHVVVSVLPSAPPDLLRVVILGRVMATVMRQRGWLPLHASGVAVDGEAVLFVGPVGSGKSTTAAAFQARGYRTISDDVMPLRMVNGVCFAGQGRSRLRLLEDSAEAFRRLDPSAEFVLDKFDFRLDSIPESREAPVRRIYVLNDGEVFNVSPLLPFDALRVLGKECFIRLQDSGPEVIKAHLRDCSQIAGQGIVAKLNRPRNMARIDDMVDFVLSDLGKASLPAASDRGTSD